MMDRREKILVSLTLAVGAVLAILAVYYFIPRESQEYGGEVVYPENPQRFIQPENSRVLSAAANLKNLEECYYWVARHIFYRPDYSLGSPEVWLYPSQTINLGKGDCEDVAILLCSLIRAKGVPSSEVRVVAGLVPSNGDVVGHAWVELRYKGKWMALEPATHGPQPPPAFDCFSTNEHREVKRYYWFNDLDYEKLA